MIDGAAVRVSLICFGRANDACVADARLDGESVDEIYTDLTARRGSAGVDLTGVRRLSENAAVVFTGDTKGGSFDVQGDLAREWLCLPANPNGRTNADVLRPWMNGMDLTRRSAGKSVVAWIGAEMEFALSQAVASGGAFEHRRSECGHCAQDFLADLDLRDLAGEAAGFELGADDALPTADLRFYPAARVVPCGRLPGHAAVAADLGNMAIPNGWSPRRLQSGHCVLRRRYNHIQGLPIPFPQQIPCGRPIIGAVRQKARDRGIELIQEPGQGGAVSSVIVSQIGANNRTARQVQSEVEFAPAAAYSLDSMLLREPFSFSEDLEAGTVHHQMDRHRSGLPHRLSDAQAVCAT